MAKLKDLSVSFLSLVAAPATGKGLTLKSIKPGERAEVFEIAKTDDERMVAYGIVYAPDQVDSHGDTADATTIRRAAYEFMREGRLKNIDTEHNFAAQMAFVAESWLVRKDDALFPAEPEGAWAVGIQIGDPDLWKALKAGELTGISLAGIARLDPDPQQPSYTEKNDDDRPPSWFTRWLAPLKSTPKETPHMEDKEVRDLIKAEVGPAVAAALKSVFAPAEAPLDPATAAAQAAEQAVTKALEKLGEDIDTKIAKAVAKGVTETDHGGAQLKETFA